MSKRRAKEYEFEFKKNKAFPVPYIEMVDQKYRTLIHFLAVNWDAIKPKVEGTNEMMWSPHVFDYIMRNSYGELCIGKFGRCIWNHKKNEYWRQLTEDVNKVRGSENMLETLNKIVAPANRYFYNLYTTFCRNIVTLRNEDSNDMRSNWGTFVNFFTTFNADTSTIPHYLLELGLPQSHYSKTVYDYFNKSLCRNQEVAMMIFAYYFLNKPYAMPAYIQPLESMVLPNDLEKRRLDETEDESKDEIDEEDVELYTELSALLDSMEKEPAIESRAESHEEEIPKQQIEETEELSVPEHQADAAVDLTKKRTEVLSTYTLQPNKQINQLPASELACGKQSQTLETTLHTAIIESVPSVSGCRPSSTSMPNYPGNTISEQLINVYTSLPMELNDPKYRTLVHLLAANWDAIKPAPHDPERLTWNRSQFDYIMRIAYGDGYTGDIGSSIWDKISDKYEKFIIEDVNNVRESKSMVEALNNVVAPANRYHSNMYTTFSRNLIAMNRDYNVSPENRKRITVFLKHFDVNNPIVSSHYIFELALPKPNFSRQDYQEFKESLKGVRRPIATMIFAHYFDGHQMPPYIPPLSSIVLPNTAKDKSGEASKGTVETIEGIIRQSTQTTEALTTEAVASTSQHSGDGGTQQHTGGD